MAQEQLAPTRREQFHALLVTLVPNVYFQAPKNTSMQYPCIKYELDDEETLFADNQPYRSTDRYQVMVIDSDPDSPIRDKVKALPLCRFDRKYVADNLHHFVYNIFF